jgi:hypothetical protein
MGLFGTDPRDEQIDWLRQRVEWLESQLLMKTDPAAYARMNPPQRVPPARQRMSHRFMSDRPTLNIVDEAKESTEKAEAVERSFRDERQP